MSIVECGFSRSIFVMKLEHLAQTATTTTILNLIVPSPLVILLILIYYSYKMHEYRYICQLFE